VRCYCTFFDHRYADKGLALFWSLIRHCSPFKLYVLCLDKKTEALLSYLGRDEIVIIRFDDLLAWDQGLAEVRSTRSLVEFYFTCKASLCLYVFSEYGGIDSITYLDSDLYYCGDPGQIDEEMKLYSVGLTSHRFPAGLRVMEKVEGSGRFNAGWIMFRNDPNGRSCLQWWRERCLEWCCDSVDSGRYADQGYLERMPDLFSGVRVIESEGVNAGPWNIFSHKVNEKDGVVYLGDNRLVCYHYHGLKEIVRGIWEAGVGPFHHRIGNRAKIIIYKRYLDELMVQRMLCLKVIGVNEQGNKNIRNYKTRVDFIFKLMPGVFRFLKMTSLLLTGVIFNSLLISQQRELK